MSDEPARELVDVETAAARLGVTARTIRNWIATGGLNAYRVGPKLIRIDLAEVDALARPVTPTSAPAGSA